MKYALFLLLFFISYPAQGQTRDEILRQLRDLVRQQKAELDQAENKGNDAIKELEKAKAQTLQVALERDGWKAYGESNYTLWMNAEVRVEKAMKQVWRLRFWMGALLLAIVAYVILKVRGLIPF